MSDFDLHKVYQALLTANAKCINLAESTEVLRIVREEAIRRGLIK